MQYPRIHSRVSKSLLYRAAVDAAHQCRATATEAAHQCRATAGAVHQAAANLASRHSRRSLVAAAATSAGVLSAVGLGVGLAPWNQALANVSATAQGDALSAASGQPGAQHSHGTLASSAGKQAGSQLDALRKPAEQARAAKQARATKPTAANQAHAAKPAPAKPYTIYDSISPGTIPAGQAAAVYADGAYAVPPGKVAGHQSVLWIDVFGTNPSADVLDVEPGDATPAGAARWVQQRLNSKPHSVAIVYTMLSEWQQVKANVAHLPGWMQSKVRYWIADPTGVSHVVPGASATQWYWGSHYDITTANPDFAR